MKKTTVELQNEMLISFNVFVYSLKVKMIGHLAQIKKGSMTEI